MINQADLFTREAALAAPRIRRAPPRTTRRTPPSDAQEARSERRWRTMWISDVHLGTRAARAQELAGLLARHACEHLYLVGDILEARLLARGARWPVEHERVARTILARARGGTRVTYVAGNHDRVLRGFAGLAAGGIELVDEAVHRTADGRELCVTHGDGFDACQDERRWLGWLGDTSLQALHGLERALTALRPAADGPRPALATRLGRRVKTAFSYVEAFEARAIETTRRRGFDGVVCGHVHHPALRTRAGFVYANTGDWVEHGTALVEDHAGRLGLLCGRAELQRVTDALLAHA